jgi:hypothetical protein
VRRLPVAAFAALAAATVGAFFVTQHLKVSTPLIAGAPMPFPADISPRQTGCKGFHSYTNFSFYLLHRADNVAVYVVDSDGTIIRTLASGRYMRRGVRNPDGLFPWNGREDNGTVAPDGTYYFRIALLRQGRTIELTKTPVRVRSTPPQPVVKDVTPALIPARGTPVRIYYTGDQGRLATLRIYRTDLPGPPRLVKSFLSPANSSAVAHWNGLILHRPTPAGTYLVGLDVTDAACNTGHFPPALPPPPGSTPHAGVTVRYLAAEPPLDPVPAGSSAVVYVDSRQRPYSWTLERAGARSAAAHGTGRGFVLRIRVPAAGPGLYQLSLRSGANRTAIPLVVSASAGSRSAGILVALPALAWQGANPVDDNGDGLPNTLAAGGPIQLQRPLAHGLPADFADEAGFLAFLARSRLRFDLTTDLALIDGHGSRLAGHAGFVLPASEPWIPSALSAALRSFVLHGGHVLSIGSGSLLRGVTVSGGSASAPTAAAAADIFGAHPGAVVAHSTDLLTVIKDGLGIFSGTSGAFGGFGSYQPIASVSAPAQPIASAAGAGSGGPAIAGFSLGRGIVVEIGLPGFGSSLAGNVDAQELVSRLWKVLGG